MLFIEEVKKVKTYRLGIHGESFQGSDEDLDLCLDRRPGDCNNWRAYGLQYAMYPVRIDFGALAMDDEEFEAVERLRAVFKPFSSGWLKSP